jgi:hypothetical protein
MSDTNIRRLIEDVKDILIERGFNARLELVTAYHEVGARIREESNDDERITAVVKRVAEAIGRSERTLWYAIRFYDKFPDLNMLPEGKDLSWREICRRYLPESSPSSPPPNKRGVGVLPAPAPQLYVKRVKESPCILHRGEQADAHHFPRTNGAGAADWHVIPLCRVCHTAAHNNPKDWLWENKDRVFGWFYSLMEGENDSQD